MLKTFIFTFHNLKLMAQVQNMLIFYSLQQASIKSSTPSNSLFSGSQICVRSLPDIVDSLHSPTCLTNPVVYSDLLKLISTLLRSLTPCEFAAFGSFLGSRQLPWQSAFSLAVGSFLGVDFLLTRDSPFKS